MAYWFTDLHWCQSTLLVDRPSHNLDEQTAEVSRDLPYSSGKLKEKLASVCEQDFYFLCSRLPAAQLITNTFAKNNKSCPVPCSSQSMNSPSGLLSHSTICVSPLAFSKNSNLQEDGSFCLPRKTYLINTPLSVPLYIPFCVIPQIFQLYPLYIGNLHNLHLVFLPLDFQWSVAVVNPAHFRPNIFQIPI